MALNLTEFIIRNPFTEKDYLAQLRKLLPTGPIWGFTIGVGLLFTEVIQDILNLTGLNILQDKTTASGADVLQDIPNTTDYDKVASTLFGRLLSCFSAEWQRVTTDIYSLYNESVPGLSTQLLEDWERVLGLPDTCTPEGDQTLDARREAAHRLVFDEYETRTDEYLIELAADLGFTISITAGSRYDNSFITGVAVCGANRLGGLGAYSILFIDVEPGGTGDEDQLQCVFSKQKPAHTVIVWNFL